MVTKMFFYIHSLAFLILGSFNGNWAIRCALRVTGAALVDTTPMTRAVATNATRNLVENEKQVRSLGAARPTTTRPKLPPVGTI